MLLLGLAYYVAARLSLRIALIEENVTPLWPPTGIALVAFLTLGRRMWPGVVPDQTPLRRVLQLTNVAAMMPVCGTVERARSQILSPER
jgi:integral membrane sensor domain MASE1